VGKDICKIMKTSSQKYRIKIKQKRKEADRIWQQIVQKLHPICEGCKKGKTQEKTQVGHHFIEKSLSNALRYDIKNGIGLSNKCHFLLHTRSDGGIYANIILNRGQKWVDYIEQNRKKLIKTNLKWYENHIERLTKELLKIEKIYESKRPIR